MLGPADRTNERRYTTKWSEAFSSDLKQVETFLSNISEGFAYCKIITGGDGIPVDWLYLDVNDSFERINEIDRSRVVGRKASEVLPGIHEAPADFIDVYGKVAVTGEPKILERYSKGRSRWFRISVYSPLKGFFVYLLEDVTARKKAEDELMAAKDQLQKHAQNLEKSVEERTEQLRIVELRLRSFLDSATDGFFLLDKDLVLLDINEIARRAYLGDNRREDLIGRNLRDVTPGMEASERYPLFKRVLETGVPEILTYKAPQIWGGAYVSLSAFKVGDGLGVITRNITKEIQLEEKLREAKRGEDIDRLSAMVAHDLRNPINTASQALEMSEKSPEKTAAMIAMARKNLGRAIEMIEQLRENTRLIKPDQKVVNIRSLIYDVVRDVALAHGVSIDSEVAIEQSDIVTDPTLLRRVLDNLITNAMEAMPEGGKIKIVAKIDGGMVNIGVSDTGIGIPPEVADKLFTPLYTTKVKGVGLGLSFCKRAIEAQGGRLTYVSSVGTGSTFTIELPAHAS